ncbi:mannose-1-phosphate guanylyltransferase [Sulfurimonas hongkongensis]|uniref:mannose-1-phosphate guanylyltransferase n=1 Tax=Sulfurimonas hongkongensis TaxID=1172190 RepID=T0JBY9_9BACT|nr:mannose-1-phosphate guanylyltransferase/mannose-6-phosphate isomerase [Sulfurimonas hongkongensis]EQB34352.1 mannose-1-phosphate guanylyltransferase [Sulfurimonas hongkongensis]
MTNIILCGGSGTRLWPISRTLMPKQFVKLFNGKSLFRLTLERNRSSCQKSFIVSSDQQYLLAQDQTQETPLLDDAAISYLLEPAARNTAPAIALACMALDKEEIVLVTPSDHLIKNEKEYQVVLERAKKAAKKDSLVTFGIKPTFAQTGFGYIEADGEDVKAFHEKPDLQRAKEYLRAGNYYWNSGMFCFKAGVFLKELQKYSPEIYNSSLQAFKNATLTTSKALASLANIITIKQDDMLKIPENSIDYAVMEKSSKVKVIRSDIGWSDVGSFDALYEELPKDENGNTINEKYVQIDSKNNLIYGDERKIATVDIEDLIIVDTGDALLISKKGSSQKVKEVVQKLRQDSQLHNIHLTAHRPWGTYTVLEDNSKYKIKRIEVKPGGRLSLQKHFHRSEHWTVVSGTAIVTLAKEEKALRANESIYIPMGELHRLENAGKLPLVLIETQIGDYLGEDDILRVEDDYKRQECN